MHKLMIDLETRSDVDITKTGVYRYADSPYFDILLFAYSVDDAPVQVVDLACSEQILSDSKTNSRRCLISCNMRCS